MARPSEPATSGARWLELAVEADLEAVEAVSEILGRVAPGGASVEPAFELVDEGLGVALDPSRPAVVRAYVPVREAGEAERAVEAAMTALGHLRAFGLRPIGELRTRLVDEADWADAWKAHFPVLRIGRRIVIRPSWRVHEPAADDVVIALDPGMAFGTGLHPTTRLCLAALERLADERTVGRVLDVGCGSGILSIAAALLGATEVLAVDVDPIAVEATAANAARNGVELVVGTWRGSVPTGDGPFDVVLANLVASLLVELAAALVAELTPAGELVASGIFRDRETEVCEAFEGLGLQVADRLSEHDWVAIRLRRPSPSAPAT